MSDRTQSGVKVRVWKGGCHGNQEPDPFVEHAFREISVKADGKSTGREFVQPVFCRIKLCDFVFSKLNVFLTADIGTWLLEVPQEPRF
jgi:hypothetical protein